MTRYQFNTYDGQTTLDTPAVHLPDLSAARRQAIELSGALIESDVGRLQLGGNWRMDVTDDRGRIQFRPVSPVLELCQPCGPLELRENAT